MGLWAYGLMSLWAYMIMGVWAYGLRGLWAYGLMDLWAYGMATIKYIFAQSRARMRRRLTFMIKSHTGISIENLEDKMWCFPEYRVLRYYRYQTKDLETRLRRDQLTDKAGKHIEIYLDDEDEAFDVEHYVEPVEVEEVQILDQQGEPVGRDDDSSSVENRTPPRAQNGQNGHVPTMPSRKRRPAEDVFDQSGPLLPPNFSPNPRSAPAWNFQQRPGPSNSQANCQPTTQNHQNNWSQQRPGPFYPQPTNQNQPKIRQQNPANLPPMNRPPPGYVPADQQHPRAPPAPQHRSQLAQHINLHQQQQQQHQRAAHHQRPQQGPSGPQRPSGLQGPSGPQPVSQMEQAYQNNLHQQHQQQRATQQRSSGPQGPQGPQPPPQIPQGHQIPSGPPQQSPQPAPQLAPRPQLAEFTLEMDQVWRKFYHIVTQSPEKLDLIRRNVNQTVCLLDGDMPPNCTHFQLFEKLNSLFPSKNRSVLVEK
ncbi:Protein CBG16042 [Caenorhabditis briggsae]|uniref:Protein CBG16042 n=1 Tax=Caenorhabditis briggsae TaxID=6238 RepID=A8XN80_CAEBR|nr:Protein CBG16042 [Caenorhabditis briggsae]CAP34311.2 Protein CBG16042 [Caenorhabditis briggsae]